MLSVAETERRNYLDWLANDELLAQALEKSIKHRQNKMWDGYIHASKLNWESSPVQQFKEHLNNYGHSTGYTRAGDLYHSDFQEVLDEFFGTANAHKEYRFRFDSLLLQGTIDRIQTGTPIGNVLFEFKTTSELGRDKAKGDRILDALLRADTRIDCAMTTSREWIKYEDEILKRLRLTEREVIAKAPHLTQMFTYCWAMSSTVQIDWAVLCYISRDSYKIVKEYWYPIAQSQDLVERAANNYMRVHKCLAEYYQTLQKTG